MDQSPYFKDPHPQQFNVYIRCHKKAVHRPCQVIRELVSELIRFIFQILDENQFRHMILWLEEQKIRHYKIEDREPLRQYQSPEWIKCYQQYKDDLACPIVSGKLAEELDWLLSYAVRLEYSDNGMLTLQDSRYFCNTFTRVGYQNTPSAKFINHRISGQI
jgi:hypothetical protein